jgi:hypothetical protein
MVVPNAFLPRISEISEPIRPPTPPAPRPPGSGERSQWRRPSTCDHRQPCRTACPTQSPHVLTRATRAARLARFYQLGRDHGLPGVLAGHCRHRRAGAGRLLAALHEVAKPLETARTEVQPVWIPGNLGAHHAAVLEDDVAASITEHVAFDHSYLSCRAPTRPTFDASGKPPGRFCRASTLRSVPSGAIVRRAGQRRPAFTVLRPG